MINSKITLTRVSWTENETDPESREVKTTWCSRDHELGTTTLAKKSVTEHKTWPESCELRMTLTRVSWKWTSDQKISCFENKLVEQNTSGSNHTHYVHHSPNNINIYNYYKTNTFGIKTFFPIWAKE